MSTAGDLDVSIRVGGVVTRLIKKLQGILTATLMQKRDWLLACANCFARTLRALPPRMRPYALYYTLCKIHLAESESPFAGHTVCSITRSVVGKKLKRGTSSGDVLWTEQAESLMRARQYQ